MPTLGPHKPMMLNQVKSQPAVTVDQLKKLVDMYDDVQPDDFSGIVDNVILENLKDLCRNPLERSLWEKIECAPRKEPESIRELQKLIRDYIMNFPQGPMAQRAKDWEPALADALQRAIEEEEMRKKEEERRKWAEEKAREEKNDWESLQKDNYPALQSYKLKYPMSAHLNELDDLMWKLTSAEMNRRTLSRYLSEWPSGRYADMARKAIAEADEWEQVRDTNDLQKINHFRFEHPGSQFQDEAERTFNRLKDEKVQDIKKNPSKVSKDEIESLINNGIFSKNDLIRYGVITEQSWEALKINRNTFPNIQQIMADMPEIKAQENCTDIFLFGTPGTGKTCLLMGLAHADGTVDEKGQSYSLNMRINGGKYASALQQYVRAGITPGRTSGNYISTIHANVSEKTPKGKFIDHPINFVEMSGEEFAIRISDGTAIAFEDMGTGATQLLRNNNRKVFFIIVDSGDDKVDFHYVRDVKDAEGNVIRQDNYDTFISQLDILNKFMGLLDQEENKEIMEKVDAIHFIVTKADRLGSHSERKERARELLLKQYSGPVDRLKKYCRDSKRINASSGYNPQVFTFSLGNFYVGDVFTFDKKETLEIVDAIRIMTSGKKERTFMDKLRDLIG